MAKSHFTETAVGFDPNGKSRMYQIDPITRTCRRVKSAPEFVAPDLSGLDAKSARQNTQLLHDYLRDKDMNPTYAGSRADLRVRCCDYEIGYLAGADQGFSCKDMRNGWREVPLTTYSFDFPSPETVYKFLTRTKDRMSTAPATGEVTVLAKGARARIDDETGKVVHEVPAVKPTRESLPDAFERIMKEMREKRLTQKEGKEQLFTFMSADDLGKKNRIGRVFKMTANLDMIEREVKLILETEYKIKAPRFEVYDFPYDRLTDVLLTAGTVIYNFEAANPKRSIIKIEMAPYRFYWRCALHLYPKAMQLMMKIADGEMQYDTFNPPKDFVVKDPYQDFDKAVLDNTPNQEALIECAKDILAYLGEPDPLDLVYAHSHQKGDKIKVYWPDYREWFYGEVIDTTYGVLIRYEDGSAEKLQVHQRVRTQ